MNSQLQSLLENNPQIWRAKDADRYLKDAIPTGYAELDAILPGGGWPANVITEMVTPQWGVGELQLFLPLLRTITQQKRWVLLISPPYVPFAPALERAGIDMDYVVTVQAKHSQKDALWGIEKALQSLACALVFAWVDSIMHGAVRRLQLAAEAGRSVGVLFRQRNDEQSPATLRIRLHPSATGVHVQVLKARGSFQYRSVHINLQLY